MASTGQPQATDLQRSILRLLKEGPRTAAQLMEALQTSQPTVSRAIQQLAESVTSFRLPGDRTPLYAALRSLPLGLNPRQRIARCLRSGNLEAFGEVHFLEGGGTLERTANGYQLYEGLPPYLAFAAPSGFLGRQLAHEASRAQPYPTSLRDWSDDHRVAYLFTQGLNASGNLIFGDAPLQRELDFRTLGPILELDKLDYYVGMATSLRVASYGSSAGGEQPKFLSHTSGSGHVIVKFAKRGSRIADLLPLEHLALRALEEVGVPASRTQLLCSDEFVFLEVQRFDRVGRHGRVGMLSAGAVDDEIFGRRDSWPEFASRCENAGVLSSEDARRIDTMAAFSELIGNTDKHFENISLLIDDDGEYLGVAPAYDILPMRYASIGGGIDPDLEPIEPRVGTIGAQPEVWALAARAAGRFWEAAASENPLAPVSGPMRALAVKNLDIAMEFVRPLLPRVRQDRPRPG